MALGLDRQLQQDFAAGADRATAKHLISSRGTFDVLNGFHDDDGSIYKRGPAIAKSAPGFGSDKHRWVWDGVLGPNLQRTVSCGNDGLSVLRADDTTTQNLVTSPMNRPVKPTVIDGMLFIPGDPTFGPGTAQVYAGSRRQGGNPITAGTVSVTQGSKVVTGAGTTWNGANPIEPGDLFRIATAAGLRLYVVESVQSNTQITLMQPIEEPTAAGLTYQLTTVANATYHGPGALPTPTGPQTTLFCTHENRLIWLEGKDTIRFSPGLDPTTGQFRAHIKVATDFHKVPQGVEIVAFESLRDRLLVFTTSGIYAITNMAFDLVDAEGNVQQRMEKVNEDVVAWGAPGICGYKGALVVPAIDGLYLVDGLGEPVDLARTFAPYIREKVAAGDQPGGAVVHNGHLFLPVLLENGTGATETLVVRLDRPVQTSRGLAFAFSRLDGIGGSMWCFARRQRPAEPPMLLAGSAEGGADRLMDCTAFFDRFNPTGDTDPDGVSMVGAGFRLETRDYSTGEGQANLVRRVRLLYELADQFGDTPGITCSVAIDGATAFTVLGTEAGIPNGDGMEWFAWEVDQRGKWIRFVFHCNDVVSSLVVRGIDFWTRTSGRVDRGAR